MPSERAARYRARQVAEAKPRARVSEQSCLHPPNIFPEREPHGRFSAPACPYPHSHTPSSRRSARSSSLCPFEIKSNFRSRVFPIKSKRATSKHRPEIMETSSRCQHVRKNRVFSESGGVFCCVSAERCLQEEKSPEIHPQPAESLQQMERASFTLFPEDNVNCSPWRERALPTHLRFQPQDIHKAAPEAVRERERERKGRKRRKEREGEL